MTKPNRVGPHSNRRRTPTFALPALGMAIIMLMSAGASTPIAPSPRHLHEETHLLEVDSSEPEPTYETLTWMANLDAIRWDLRAGGEIQAPLGDRGWQRLSLFP